MSIAPLPQAPLIFRYFHVASSKVVDSDLADDCGARPGRIYSLDCGESRSFLPSISLYKTSTMFLKDHATPIYPPPLKDSSTSSISPSLYPIHRLHPFSFYTYYTHINEGTYVYDTHTLEFSCKTYTLSSILTLTHTYLQTKKYIRTRTIVTENTREQSKKHTQATVDIYYLGEGWREGGTGRGRKSGMTE